MPSTKLDAAATPAFHPIDPGSATWRCGIDWRGLLPDTVPSRLRIEWSAERQQHCQRTVTVVRAFDRALPDRIRYSAAQRTQSR
jgi:uncharacterized protein (DUF2236 family)